jgi:hypothetical protein
LLTNPSMGSGMGCEAGAGDRVTPGSRMLTAWTEFHIDRCVTFDADDVLRPDTTYLEVPIKVVWTEGDVTVIALSSGLSDG